MTRRDSRVFFRGRTHGAEGRQATLNDRKGLADCGHSQQILRRYFRPIDCGELPSFNFFAGRFEGSDGDSVSLLG